ncbi:uncharacterized protein LOC112569682 [Pomacea canaliculata]|uniref:uncharacterized protein LOC112569682 n=1 Tax=Pomacea canaliculata TaxID=400727 RepID=UPI000D73C61B|nr:uncharacterized protein LOC112569682 [Pomacea canaliculata]
MNCSFHYTDACELHVPIPDKTETDFVIYFSPHVGEQRSVVRCEWSDHYSCDSEPGFLVNFQNAQKAVITLPSSFEEESGKFKWHVLGSAYSNSGGCSWNPKETCFPVDKYEEVSSTRLMRFETSLKPEYSEYGDNNHATIIGAAAGAAVLICLILILLTGILLWKKCKSKGRDRPNQPKMDEPSCTITEHRENNSSDIKDGEKLDSLLPQNPSVSSLESLQSAKSYTPLLKHYSRTETSCSLPEISR